MFLSKSDKIFFIMLLSAFPLSFSFGQEHFGYARSFLTQLEGLLSLTIPVILALALVFFLWGMAVFILNAGNEDKRKEGKQRMFWGIIILVVIFSFWGIMELLQLTFGTVDGDVGVPSFPGIPGLQN